MICLLRKHDIISVPPYAAGIYHRTKVRYHIADISPVPTRTDIIEIALLSKRQKSYFCCICPKRCVEAGYLPQKYTSQYHSKLSISRTPMSFSKDKRM